jgi:hypothetical protein
MRLLAVLVMLAFASGCLEEPSAVEGPPQTTAPPVPVTQRATTTSAPEAPPLTTGTTSTTTTSSLAPPTTTTLEAVCSVNLDCGSETNRSLYCDDNVVTALVSIPLCKMPDTAEAACEYKQVTRKYEHCYNDYCFKGACYPATCGNLNLDYNEEDIDCGGVCAPCSQVTGKTCRWDSECGTDKVGKLYSCYNGDVVRYRTVYRCVNRTCGKHDVREVYDDCHDQAPGTCAPDKEVTCVDGDDGCKCGKATCNDCIMNQDETDIDCGGRCEECAPRPTPDPNIDTYREFNLTSLVRVVPHRGYEFRYLGPVMQGGCTNGGVIQVRLPDQSLSVVNVTRWANAAVGPRTVGFYWANDTAADIWASM